MLSRSPFIRRADISSNSVRRCPITLIVFQVIRRRVRQNLLVYFVFAECLLVFFKPVRLRGRERGRQCRVIHTLFRQVRQGSRWCRRGGLWGRFGGKVRKGFPMRWRRELRLGFGGKVRQRARDRRCRVFRSLTWVQHADVDAYMPCVRGRHPLDVVRGGRRRIQHRVIAKTKSGEVASHQGVAGAADLARNAVGSLMESNPSVPAASAEPKRCLRMRSSIDRASS
jgi:hypothetical protein